jgi:uncharacterized membrane protein YdjX (TVP38/TMEM64 family)
MIRLKFNFRNKVLLYLFIIFILAMALLLFIYQDQLKMFYNSPETVKQYIIDVGVFGPVIFIALYLLQAFVFFIPSSVLTMAGGYAFGILWGTVYSLIGITIGSIITFFIARKLGRQFFRKIIHKKELEHFDVFFKKRGDSSILLARSIPMLFPMDVVSIAAGLTQIRFRHYLTFSILGFIPNLIMLTLFGESLSKGMNPAIIAIIVLIVIAALSYMFRHQLKIFFIKEIKDHEEKIARKSNL